MSKRVKLVSGGLHSAATRCSAAGVGAYLTSLAQPERALGKAAAPAVASLGG